MAFQNVTDSPGFGVGIKIDGVTDSSADFADVPAGKTFYNRADNTFYEKSSAGQISLRYAPGISALKQYLAELDFGSQPKYESEFDLTPDEFAGISTSSIFNVYLNPIDVSGKTADDFSMDSFSINASPITDGLRIHAVCLTGRFSGILPIKIQYTI